MHKVVKEVYSGYAGGSTVNPNYYQVMTGRTGHAESIEIIYDESVIKFEMLLKVFFDSHDPTTMNRQGPDYGTQYRSIAFYSDEREKEKINIVIQVNGKKRTIIDAKKVADVMVTENHITLVVDLLDQQEYRKLLLHQYLEDCL